MESNWQKGVDAFAAGRKEEALNLLQIAVQENPTDAEAHKFLGAVLAQSGRPAEAVTQLRQAVQLSPHNAQIHYNLGVAQLMNGDSEGAKASYYSALQLNPAYEQARTALSQMNAPLPPIPTAAPNPSTADANQPFNAAGALITHGPPAIVEKPNGADYFKAVLFGGLAALVGAFIWDKFVYYTHIEFGLISVGIGVLVGMAIVMATGGRRSVILQAIGAILALWGMLLGYALLAVDEIKGSPTLAPQVANAHPLSLLLIAFMLLPRMFAADPISLAFVAFGAYEGWKIPGVLKEALVAAPTATPVAQTIQNTPPPSDPPKPLN